MAKPKRDPNRLIWPLYEVEFEKSGCTECGRGVDKLVIRVGDEQQVLHGHIAWIVWSILEDEALANAARAKGIDI